MQYENFRLQNNFSKIVKDNLTSFVTEHRNLPQPIQIPFLPPPPPLRLSQQKPTMESPAQKQNLLEDNYLAAKNAAAMMKLQASLHTASSNANVCRYEFNKYI